MTEEEFNRRCELERRRRYEGVTLQYKKKDSPVGTMYWRSSLPMADHLFNEDYEWREKPAPVEGWVWQYEYSLDTDLHHSKESCERAHEKASGCAVLCGRCRNEKTTD